MVNNAAAGRALGRGAPAERSERADGRLRRRAVFDERAPIGGRAPAPNKITGLSLFLVSSSNISSFSNLA